MGSLSLLLIATGIRLVPEVIDLGYFPPDEIITFEFHLQNPTRSPVRVLKVHPFCDCFEVEDYDTIIFPYLKGKVSVRFNSRGMSGPFNKEILVRTDRFGSQYLKFWLTGFIIDPPIEPTSIDLRKNPARIIIYPYSSRKLKIVSKPPSIWTNLVKRDNFYELVVFSFKTDIRGGVKIDFGWRALTIPVTGR
ncbi:MAG TPA: DUF1573 domain-containing protein [bacterium (Candidatus Stahlbacteria)]|nr:DUF1573 domain-containing protein [Candidatus Stahlbacteria bacterium]